MDNTEHDLLAYPTHRNVIKHHLSWLARFESWRKNRWEQQLNNDVESALCEAWVRQVLQMQAELVEPNEHPSDGGPDFICTVGNNHFYVESTCISIETATTKTKLSHLPSTGTNFVSLHDSLRSVCSAKAKQCSVKDDAPSLLAIGTLHMQASDACFGELDIEWMLTGVPHLAVRFDIERRRSVGEPYQATHLRQSTFIRPAGSGNAIEDARQSISGVLLCGFGCVTSMDDLLQEVRGALHFNAVRPFDRSLLPDIRFCRLASIEQGKLKTEWI